MARSYTNRSTAIWREPSFRALSADEQHALFLIESQPDISAAGTLPLTLRRWAAMFRDGTVDGLRRALGGLEDAGRIVVDEVTEELLVVAFIADDRSFGNTKRSPVILRAASEVVSLAIRQALAVQFERVGLPTDVLSLPPNPDGPPPPSRRPDSPSDRQSDSPSDRPSATNEENPEKGESSEEGQSAETGQEAEKSQVDRLSDSLSDRHTQFDGTVGCTSSPFGQQSTVLISQSAVPASAPVGAAGVVAATLGTDADETREIIDHIRRHHRPRNLTGYVRTMAANGDLPPILDDVRREKSRRAATLARQAARAALPDPAAEPATAEATAEEAAAARAALRNLLAGRKTGGDPAVLGSLLGRISA